MMPRSGPRPTLTSNQKALYRSQVMENSSHSVDGNITDIYKPIRAGLDRVQHNLEIVCEDNSPFVNTLLRHVLGTCGKGVRPAITLLASRFHKNDGHHAEIMASAVELLHVATLIHDDTVDESLTRRGLPTLSSIWGKDVAVQAGDYVFASSGIFMCDAGNIRVLRRFSQTIMELATGQLRETELAFDPDQTREDYFERIYNKTASLFQTAGESGAILSEAPEQIVNALSSYGRNIGLCFQIIDDVLDLDGTENEIGKTLGRDLANGVLTLPAILAIEKHPKDNPIRLLCQDQNNKALLDKAMNMVQQPEILRDSYKIARSYLNASLENLTALQDNPEKQCLIEIAHYAFSRRL